MFAVFTLLDDEQFELLVSVAEDMGLMSASELAEALYAEPLAAGMDRKAQDWWRAFRGVRVWFPSEHQSTPSLAPPVHAGAQQT